MQSFPRLLFCLGLLLIPLVQAKHKHHDSPTPAPLATPAAEPPLPAEAAPQIGVDAPPSASLQPFLDTHLGKILTQIEAPAFAQPELIASIKASYADGQATAPPARRAAFQLAQSVCDALTGAITERQDVVSALRGALATRSSEAEQPRGGGEAVAEARERDTLFADSQKNNWIQRAAALRQSIINLYLRESAVERQIGAWSPPVLAAPPVNAPAPGAPDVATAAVATVPVTAAVPAATPSVSAPPAAIPEAPSQGWDPVIGQWLLEGRDGLTPLTLGADHTITGGRHGTLFLYH